MENAYCQCGTQAVLYCGCQSMTIYLCGQCVALHLSKPGKHGLLQIGMDLAAIGQSIAVGRIVAEFSDVMDHIREIAEREQAETDSFLTQQCERDVEAITSAYSRLRTHFSQRYTDLKSALETAKQEAKANSSQSIKAYSPASLALIEASSHLFAKESNIIPVASIVQSRIKVVLDTGKEAKNSPIEDIQQWGLGPCGCEGCKKMWQGLLTTKQTFDIEAKIKQKAEDKETEAKEEQKRREDEARTKAELAAQEEAKVKQLQQLNSSNAELKASVESLQQRLEQEAAQTTNLKAKNDLMTEEIKQLKEAMEMQPPGGPWGGPPPPPGGHWPPPPPGGPWGGPPPPHGGPWGGPPPPHGGHHWWKRGRHHHEDHY